MKSAITVNKGQKLYVIPTGGGYSCLAFKVCYSRAEVLQKELKEAPVINLGKPGTIKLYNQYLVLVEFARKKHLATGWRSESELIPEFIGREGWRVEVLTSYGDIERFIIGKSTGFIPCHLEIRKSNSTGGGAVCGYPFKSIRFIERVNRA